MHLHKPLRRLLLTSSFTGPLLDQLLTGSWCGSRTKTRPLITSGLCCSPNLTQQVTTSIHTFNKTSKHTHAHTGSIRVLVTLREGPQQGAVLSRGPEALVPEVKNQNESFRPAEQLLDLLTGGLFLSCQQPGPGPAAASMPVWLLRRRWTRTRGDQSR